MNRSHETVTRTPEETMALGEQWAAEAKAGWVIGLSGDLGAGKTQLVKGLARGLGHTGKVSSPTFALVNEYTGGRLPLAHLDLYRLDTHEQVIGAGLEPYLTRPEGVAVVEWIERWWPLADLPSLPGQAVLRETHISGNGCRGGGPIRLVRIDSINETERRICHVDLGV
jgi:tRNA threonylcarbamoyladenosine biosynthesis protein TsaE